MAASLMFRRINVALANLERTLVELLNPRGPPPDAFCLVGVEGYRVSGNEPKPFSIKDIIGDGLLWAVPKHRRSLEKRLKRKFGDPEYVNKLILPKTTLRVCNTCGDDHEVGVLCPTCYKKVIEETKLMQDKIQEELKLEPVETEVVVLYNGEKDDKPSEFWQGKRIVEMEKERPSWFSKNLTQQTTQQPATTSDVKPSQLG
ncbi:PREDICTED: 39S ribosomal protein L32, mitochondrial [Nicrophorus vespilloides]|uniref:Large ribosomal subunit protein bL32m n=1 Tax=Nicrophorus vespilloides TaxID=110193 RepID=A0ABM1MCQ2_NICVS|nr:PREDICTED: 39S ribosomal protein L32, mitochondrial [Nicrophorus vespilloides]